MIIVAIISLLSGAILATITILVYCLCVVGKRADKVAPRPEPINVYLMERETARIAVEFDQLAREEGWKR